MSDFEGLTMKQVLDLGNKIGGQERAKRFMSGELVLVEKTKQISANGLADGGVNYAGAFDVVRFLADWTKFYQDVYAMTVDLSQVPFPAFREGFLWGGAVVPGITNQRVFTEFEDRRPAWKNVDNLDTAVPTNDRNPDKPYIFLCRNRVEADDELKNLSANQIETCGITTMMLLERQLLGRWFYWKTDGCDSRDLDVVNVTLCAGSRGSRGYVPSVHRHSHGEVHVLTVYYDPGHVHANLRSREVVLAV